MRLFFTLILIFTTRVFASDSLIFIIRVDDIQSRNTVLLPKSIKDFQTAVENKGGKVTWAVIPHRIIETQNYDGLLVQDLKSSILNGHEVVLHGYNHICPECGSTGHEMYCTTKNKSISYLTTTQLLIDGKKLLLDSLNIIPRLFVPPGHSADSITFKVLLEKNISYLSSIGGTKLFIYGNLFNLQQNNEYTWSMTSSNYTSQLNAALTDIKNMAKSNGYYCLLLHDPFIRKGYENGIVIRWIGELMDSLNKNYSGNLTYMTLSQAAEYYKNKITNIYRNDEIKLKNFSLCQNYPNPFNPTTKISYEIPVEEGFVTLKVYDILGKLIKTLINERQTKGKYTVEFSDKSEINVSILNSGIYLYELQCGSYRSTRKMIYIK